MREMIGRTLNCKPYMTMAFNAFVTTVVGAILLAPYDTFHSSPVWRTLGQIHVARWYPTEESWGAIFFALGVSMWTSLYFLANLEAILESRPIAHAGRLPTYRFSALVWQLGLLLWLPLGLSFIFAKPDSIGAWIFMAMGALSEWIAWRIGRIIRAAA